MFDIMKIEEKETAMKSEQLYAMSFAKLYPAYTAKALRKGKSIDEVNQIIMWLTGYSPTQLSQILDNQTNLREFFDKAPCLHPNRELIMGSICGVKISEIEDPLMKNIRYLDKLIDELANGKPMVKILRK